MKNNLKLIFFMMMILSTIFLMSSTSWFNMWLWLEINLISFISFMINNKKKNSIESCLIYFLFQTIASIMLIFSVIMMMFNNNLMKLFLFSIMLKIGSAPFHYWLPLMIEGMNWINIFLLLTWQKINPLMILLLNNELNLLNMFIILSLMMSTMSSLNYSSMKKIMAFSSINQLSWMIISLNFNKLFNLYMIFYFYLMWNISYSFKLLNINYINQMYNLYIYKNFYKLFIFTNLMSIGGLPPFLGFFPKMMIIMKMNNLMLMFMMLMFSLIMLFMYLRMMMMMLLLNSIKINIFKIYKNKKNYMIMMSYMNNMMILFMMMIF